MNNPGFTEAQLPPVRELARRYGVSKGTVEKALSYLTRQGRVHGEIGRGTFIVRHRPNAGEAIARVVIFAPEYGRRAGHYLQSITQGLGEFALKRRLETIVLFLDPAEARRRIALERERLLLPGTGAVVLHTGTEIADLLFDLEAAACPAVLVGNGHFPGKPLLGLDDGDGVRRTLAHLFELGRRRIVFLGAFGDAWPHRERLAAFKAFESDGRIAGALRSRQKTLTLAGGHALTGEALAQFPDLDALVCVNDRLALGAVIRLREEGKRIPSEVAVAGFDNDPLLVEDFIPPITSVGYDGRELGRRALLALLGEAVDPVVPVELVVRESTAGSREAPDEAVG
ncbi:MAG: LacI family DNA-binding transcriptional regulator [Spirochaetes bacterium]|nr:LacI family DNA-binding transcriptional regulator [Spirochaetota bacterium]